MASEGHKESLVSQLVGVHVAMIALAAVTVISRLAVRWTLTEGGFGGDDIVIAIALLLATGFVGVNLEQTKFGLGQHVKDLPPTTDHAKSQELFYFGEMIYYITVGTTKIAILLLYLRIIPHNNKAYRYGIFGVMAFVALTVIACVIANIFQCTPIDFAWNKHQNGHCINQVALYYSNAGLDIFQDIVIYLLPIRILYQLQLPRNQKIALIAIFIVGGFVCVTGMIRLSSLKTAAVTDDPTWYNVAAANWSAVEICVGIFCASLVHFRPLISRVAPRLISPGSGSAHSATYGVSRTGNRAPLSRSQYTKTGPHYDVELLSEPGRPRLSDGSFSQNHIYVKRDFYTN